MPNIMRAMPNCGSTPHRKAYMEVEPGILRAFQRKGVSVTQEALCELKRTGCDLGKAGCDLGAPSGNL